VHWAVQANALPTDHIDIYKTPEQYIACLLHWIKQRRDSSLKLRKQAVATLVRRECHVFAGVGVYTVCEVFFIAGLSLLMTEEELFTDESRVGRLFGAMYTWGHLAHTAHSEFVCTVVVNWKICPTFKEKQRWYRFMNVQCKDRAPSSVRKQVLHKRFVQGVAAGERHSRLHDVFEPTDIQTALVDIPELCDPIFGSKADQFKMEIKASDVRQTQTLLPELARILLDQFIPFFRKGLGAFKMASQSLDLSMYDTFFLPTSEIQGKERRLKTILLKIDGKFAWTVLPPTICQLKASDSTMSSQLQFGPQRQAVLSHGTSRTLSRDEEASDSSDTDTFESEMPVVTTRQSASSNNAKGKGKGKVSQGFHKFGAGRRSAIVICDEKLRTKKLHTQFNENSLVHNTGPLDFAGTPHRISRTGANNDDDFMILLLAGDYRAGRMYGDRLVNALFRGRRVLTRAGISFKSADDFKDKLQAAQNDSIYKAAEERLMAIMVERGILDELTGLEAERAGLYNIEDMLETSVSELSDEGDDDDDESDEALESILIEGEQKEEARVIPQLSAEGEEHDDEPVPLLNCTSNYVL